MTTNVHHQFYEHPSISTLLVCHLADNHEKPDAAQGRNITNLEKAIKKIVVGLMWLQQASKWM
jgi:hypothetical protein